MKEIKVDILPLINKLEAVLKKGFSRELLAGTYQSVFKGKGLEFVGFREYSSEDDALLIDWRATLRAHRSMVKVMEEERDLTVFFLFDVSDSMLFSSHNKLKCEFAAELIGTLSYAMHQVGDNVGMAMFSDRINPVIPPAIGRNQFYRIIRTLKDPSYYGGSFDLNYSLNYILNLGFVPKEAIVFIISDFIGLKPGWENLLKVAGLKYDLSLFVIRDPVDMRLPDMGGEVYLKDPFSPQNVLIDPAQARQDYEQASKSQISRLQTELKKTNSSLLTFETDKDFTGAVFEFFRRRQKYKS